jgi:hypothetical protein
MNLPPSGRLAVPDLRSGMAFLARLPISNPMVAHPSLAEFIESLIEAPPPFQVFVQLLEQARNPLAHLQAEIAKVYLGRAIPLGESEEAVFLQVVRAWQRMARAYSRCAQLDNGTDPEQADRVATILQRCIRYSGLAILEHFRVRRDLPGGLWLDFYGYYDTAEEWKIAHRPVYEPMERQRQSSNCASELVAVLLTELAGPYSYSVRDIDIIMSWARLWSPLVGISELCIAENAAQYAIDLYKDVGIRLCRPDSTHAASMRQLDTARLAIQIEQSRLQLEQRMTPPQIGLGDCMTGEARKLLDEVSRPWAQIASPRRFRRRPAQGNAMVASSFDNIYHLVAGKDFTQPVAGNVYSRKEYELLYAFRHRVDPNSSLYVENTERDVPADAWEVLNESANGFRLERRSVGQRVAHKQLLGIRPPDGDRYVLAQAHWLMQERDNGLVCGVEVLPGSPEPVAVRRVQTVTNAAINDPFSPAFLLPEVQAMSSPASLVIPAGWYQAGRMLEMHTTTNWQVRLTGVFQRGSDFDRVGFVMAG